MAKPGWSEETVIKPEILREIGGLEFGIVERIHRKGGHLGRDFPFTYVDLTGGPGVHRNGTQVAGAAATFHSLLRHGPYSFHWEMHVIEERLQEYLDLGHYFENETHVHCYRGASEEIAPRILDGLRYAPFGIVCLDPNGFGVREERLIKQVAASRGAERMDWLLHLPSRTIKRVRCCRETQFSLDLLDLIGLTRKRRGLIKLSPSQTKQDWIYVFLTNAGRSTIHEWKRRGWHDMESPLGREILKEANHTVKELESIKPADNTPGRGQMEQMCLF